MINFNQLRCFVQVAELKNFSKAAEKLFISPTAVSKQIKNLEHQLSEQLFLRSTRQVALTEFGELFYQRVQALLAEVDITEQFITAKKATPQGYLKVLVSTILATDLVLNHLAEFRQQYPLIQLELLFSEQDIDTSQSDIDVLVGFPEIPPYTDHLKFRKMYCVNNVLCASPTLLSQSAPVKEPADLLQLPFISHSLRKPATRLPLADGNYLISPAPILFMDNFHALNRACIDGLGVFLTGDLLVEQALADNKLVQLLPDIDFKQYQIYMFYQAVAYEQPKVRAFLDFYSRKLKK